MAYNNSNVLTYIQDFANDHVEFGGAQELMKKLIELNGGQFSRTDSDLFKRVRGLLAKLTRQIETQAQQQTGSAIRHNERHAEKAIRTRQYKKNSGNVGAYVTALRTRRNGASSPRPIPPTKSGRERAWSERTKQLYGYQGEDAQFILYWLTQGTQERMSGLGRANRKTGRYGSVSTSRARKKYFNGSHNVGRINPNTVNTRMVEIFERVVNGEFIPGLEQIVQDIYNEK